MALHAKGEAHRKSSNETKTHQTRLSLQQRIRPSRFLFGVNHVSPGQRVIPKRRAKSLIALVKNIIIGKTCAIVN